MSDKVSKRGPEGLVPGEGFEGVSEQNLQPEVVPSAPEAPVFSEELTTEVQANEDNGQVSEEEPKTTKRAVPTAEELTTTTSVEVVNRLGSLREITEGEMSKLEASLGDNDNLVKET